VRGVRATVLLFGTVLAGCTSAPAHTAAPMTALATHVPASVAITAAPTEQPELTDPPPSPCGLSGSGEPACTLSAGAYATSAFTVTLPSPWVKWAETTQGGELYPSAGAIGGILWMVNPHRTDDVSTTPATAADVRAAMADLFKDATASDVTATTLGGNPAETFDLALGDNDPTQYLAVDSSNFRLGPREKVRFIVARHGADTVVIVVDAFTSAAFDDVVVLTKPLLDSLVWS
jgi:hypothetical protein